MKANKIYSYNKRSTGAEVIALEFFDEQRYRTIDITDVLKKFLGDKK